MNRKGNMATKTKNWLGHIIALLSTVGLVATFWQTAEKIQLLKYPEDPLSCNINPIVDCGSVLNDGLSAVFGVPNAMIGMVAFSILLTFGLLMMTGVKLTHRAQQILVVLSLAMFAFSVWFFAASLYVIGKICIFCVAIWAATIPLTIVVNGNYGNSVFPDLKLVQWKLNWFKQKPWQATVVLYLLALILFMYRFRDYYFG